MSEHTKEPWYVGNKDRKKYESLLNIRGTNEGLPGLHIDLDDDGFEIAVCNQNFIDISRENARRIVACVNACAGIPTDKLENKVFNTAGDIKQLFELVELEKQRDELKEKIESIGREHCLEKAHFMKIIESMRCCGNCANNLFDKHPCMDAPKCIDFSNWKQKEAN